MALAEIVFLMPDQNPKPDLDLTENEATRAAQQPDSGAFADSSHQQESGQDTSGPIGYDGDRTAAQDSFLLTHNTLANGKYQVNQELGRGGMSVVYAATDTTLGRKVAVKVLLAEYALAAGPEAIKRFQQEARSVAKLSHPHIISIYEYGVLPDGAPFIVMDFIVGASLADEMDAHGVMPEERVFEIVKQSAEALRHSHAQGVVHRDIKPSNLLLTRGDEGEDYVRVVDFGIAKMQDQDATGKLTRTGQVFGSPLYMSPEQCEGLPADARSDLYSLGCVAYELITGRPPHVGKNAVETMHRKMTSDPTPFALGEDHYRMEKKKSSAAGLDQGAQFRLAFQKIILKMLAASPDNRHQNADELLSEIKQIKGMLPDRSAGQEKVVPQKEGKHPPVRHKPAAEIKAVLLAAGLIAAGAIVAAVSFNMLEKQPGPSLPPGPVAQSAPVTPPPVPPGPVPAGDSAPAQPVAPAQTNPTNPTLPTLPPAQPSPPSSGPGFRPIASPDQLFGPGPVLPKKGFFTSTQSYWNSLQRDGHAALMAGNFDLAAARFREALNQAGKLGVEHRLDAEHVSLGDAIDLAQIKGLDPSATPEWQRYQEVLRASENAYAGTDKPLLNALEVQKETIEGGSRTNLKDLNETIRKVFAQATKEFNEQSFGNAQRLLFAAEPLLKDFHSDDGGLAKAFHMLSTIAAVKNNWPQAVKYANLAVKASQEGNQKEINMSQAYYLQGWAQAHLPDTDPSVAYKTALEIDTKIQPKNDLNRLCVLRKLTQYYLGKQQREKRH